MICQSYAAPHEHVWVWPFAGNTTTESPSTYYGYCWVCGAQCWVCGVPMTKEEKRP